MYQTTRCHVLGDHSVDLHRCESRKSRSASTLLVFVLLAVSDRWDTPTTLRIGQSVSEVHPLCRAQGSVGRVAWTRARQTVHTDGRTQVGVRARVVCYSFITWEVGGVNDHLHVPAALFHGGPYPISHFTCVCRCWTIRNISLPSSWYLPVRLYVTSHPGRHLTLWRPTTHTHIPYRTANLQDAAF